MRSKLAMPALGLALALSGCATMGTQSSQPGTARVAANSHCGELTDLEGRVAEVYSADRVRNISPLYRNESPAAVRTRASTNTQGKYLAGTQLTIPAERGSNEAYTQRVLSCYAATAQGGVSHPGDPLTAQGVDTVTVETRGANLLVNVTGSDRAAGRDIWQRADSLRRGANVEVMQISAAQQNHADM